MKRTVTRWVSEGEFPRLSDGTSVAAMGTPHAAGYGAREVTITYDDGQPEERCPCVVGHVCCPPAEGMKHCECCKNVIGRTRVPCLSDFHKQPAQSPMPLCECGEPDRPHEESAHRKPAPATRDRVVKGCVTKPEAEALLAGPTFKNFHSRPPQHEWEFWATLIIHEPAKEPTLYEAVEQWLHGVMAATPETHQEIVNAFNREKAAREKEGK